MVFIGILLGNFFDSARLRKNFAGHSYNVLAHIGNFSQMLTATDKDLYAQLVFQKSNLLAHPWLRSKKRLSSDRDIEVVFSDLPNIP